MATLSLKISIDEGRVVKTIQFDPSTTVYDACRLIRDKILEANLGEPKEYGLFLYSEEDMKKGVWLEPARSLEYYILRNGDILEYKKKLRTLRVRMLDGSVKTLLVDDSQNVANLMVVICTKIGITNYDEYSLVRDDRDELDHSLDGKGNYGTLTLKRRHQTPDKERDAKMDQLRKKLRTDDEVNWVDPAKTLREQGVEESETLLLRRKFFFSDRNVDGSDPVQLGLLYVQARDAILEGMHPVTMDKACEFAGIQCQIQFGDHKEDKHTAGLLDLKEFLPASYAKVKGVEKKVFKEHRTHQGLSELEAKVLYTKTARDLKTYGVAFFLVKEKMKGKNKLVPRLLGVTKDSVLRLDEKTKEILQTWPLTTVRRWCASPNTFTLDFGDYSDQYYSVQTTEAEQILQVIAGYIDIILKKQRAKEHFGIEGDEGSTMVEDSVSPLKATILQHESSKVGKLVNTESLAKPAVMRAGNDGVKPYSTGYMAGAQYTTVSGQVNVGHTPPNASLVQQTKITTVTTEPQRALLSTITTGQEIIKKTEREITRAVLPDVGNDAASIKWKEVQLDTNKQSVTSHIAAMNAATAQVVTLTSGTIEEVDHTAVGEAITTITSNLPEMTKGVQMIAALLDDDDNGDKLLEATRKLCTAFSDLLKAAEPEAKEPRQSLLNAASRVGEASTQVLYTISEDAEESKEIQDILLALAKAVANTTAALVLKAKGVAASCGGDTSAQNRVIAAATQCALATSQLVACAKVVAPTLDNAACRRQISAAAAAVGHAVEALLAECCNNSASGHPGDELKAAAGEVSSALADMLRHVESQGVERQRATRSIQETTTVETVMSATEELFASEGDSTQMVNRARLLGQATAKLIQDIKTEAETRPLPEDAQRRLLKAARRLADATAKLVEAARACASAPEDAERRRHLRAAAIDVREATEEYARPRPLEPSAQLQQAARQAVSAATQFATVAHNATQHCTIRHVQETLYEETNLLTESVPPLIEAVKVSSARPSDVAAHLDLIDSSETFLQSGTRAAAGARAALAALDSAESRRLTPAAKDLATASSDLRSAVSQARAAYEDRSLEAAATTLRSLQRQLDDTAKDHSHGSLVPLPGETPELCSATLSTCARSTSAGVSRLVEGAKRGDAAYAGAAARDLTRHTRQFVDSVRGVAATADSHEDGERVIDSAQGLLTYSVALIETTHRYFVNAGTQEITELQSIAKNVTQSLNNTVNTLPSHRDVDSTIENINETLQILSMGEFPPTNKSYSELQHDLNNAAVNLNTASADVVTGVWSRKPLGDQAKNFGSAYEDLLTVTMEMAGQTKDDENRTQMVESMRGVSLVSSKLLSTARSVNRDPGQPDAKNKLASAARAVTDSINYLVDVCTSAAPGQKECDNAIRSIQSAKPLLQNPSEPVNNLNYFSCMEAIIDHSKTLGDGMSGMANHAKNSDHVQFGQSVRTVSDSVCGLVECTAQAAFLVGVSDEHSVAGRAGTVDAAQFARASQAIQQACQGLSDPNTNQHQVLSAATVIARHTSALCNACRSASAAAPAASAKRHFVQAAKDVANSTATLVKEIKALDADYSQANRSRCAAATTPLLEAVQGLCQFANSPEFSAVPAKISVQGRRSQMPILESGRNIISGSCSMIESAKCLAVQPADRNQWQSLAQHSRTLSDSIRSLVNNIRDKAPGQQECLRTIETLNMLLRQVDQTSLLAVSQSLQPCGDNTLEGFTEHLESAATEMLERLEPLRAAAKNEAENLGHTVTQMATYANSLVSAAEGAASLVVESRAQSSLLDCTKTVLEGTVQLIAAAKNSAGNPIASNAHSEVDNECIGVRSALTELLNTCEEVSAQRGLVSGLVDNVTRAMERVTDHRMSLIGSYNESDSFVDYQTRMVGAAKEIARIATDMIAKASTDPSRLTQLGGDAGHRYSQLAQDSVGAAATTSNTDIAQRIRSAVVELGASLVDLVRAGGNCQLGLDERARSDVVEFARHVTEKVGGVLSALQAGSKGTQACIDAVSTVSAIIGDLETTILFASAGTLSAEKDSDSFADHREAILKTAKSLVEDTKTLVGGAAGSQEQLAEAARDAVKTIVQLSEVVKLGAMSLGSGNPDSQVMLIHAVRDVAAALRDLIQATKDASGKHIGDPAMSRLKDSAKVMVTNVTSLLKTVKAVEDEHTRGTRALESTIEAIAQEIRLLMSPGAPKLTATPEELVRCTKAITVATAKAVAAGNSGKQDDIIAAANIGRKAIGDMLAICKGAAHSCAETPDLRERTLKAGAETANAYRDLLQAIHQGVSGGGSAAKAQYPELSRRVAQCAGEIVAVAETLKGSDWVDPDDPTVIAENELLGAAASIDAAANKLAALRPRKNVKEADETLNFDEMILEAAKSIIAATSALVRAASAAQRELIDQGLVARRPLTSSDDGQWSEGLVSAARLVAAAAHSLVEAANALVQGCGSEERLVGSAKQVAGTTAQLLVACKVKADPNSETTRRLQAAGAAVIRSTDNLVSAARQAISLEEERCLVLNRRMVGGIAQEIDARSEVLRIERQLEEARGRLTAIRQAKYKLKTGDTSGDETDNEITLHSTGNSYNASPSPFSLNSTRQDGGYSSESPTRFAGYNSTLDSSKQTTRVTYNQANDTYNQQRHPGTFSAPQNSAEFNHSGFGQSGLRQTSSAYSSPQQQTHTNGVSSDYGQSVYIQQSKTPLSPPPPPPPPLSSFSSFGRTGATSTTPTDKAPPLNYEGFTTRIDNSSSDTTKHDYETRSYDTPRPARHDGYRSSSEQFRKESNEYSSSYKDEKTSTATANLPLSPKFNARFDLNRSFEDMKKTEGAPSPFIPSFLPAGGGQSFTQTQKSTEKLPTGIRNTEYTIKSESYQSQPYYSSEFRTENVSSHSKPSKIPTPTREISKIISPKSEFGYGGPNYSEESSTEVRDIPNGTQKITTTKIYSSTPVKITSTNTKPVNLESLFDGYSTDTMRSYGSSDSELKPSFLQPSDYRQTEYSTVVSKSGKTPMDLAQEIDFAGNKLSKQTVSSEVLEKKTVMTTSSKSEVSRTTTQKFGLGDS